MQHNKNKNYELNLKAIRPFTNLGIKNRKNFTPSQKRMITIYHDRLVNDGLIEKDGDRYIQKVKFQKNKKSNIKGNPRIAGVFVHGAMPNDRINKKGQIIKNGYLKTFIPLDLSGIIEFEGEENRLEYIKIKLEIALNDFKLKEKDYFTIVLQGGWEIGQNMRAKTPLSKRHHGTKFTENKIRKNKIRELTDRLFNYMNTSINKYKVAENLITGLYHYDFKNQRQPTNKEKSIIKGK